VRVWSPQTSQSCWEEGGKLPQRETIHLQPQLLRLCSPTLPGQTSPMTATLCEGKHCPSPPQTPRSGLIMQMPPCSRGTALANPEPRGSPFLWGCLALTRVAAGAGDAGAGDAGATRCSLGIFLGLQRPLFQHGQNWNSSRRIPAGAGGTTEPHGHNWNSSRRIPAGAVGTTDPHPQAQEGFPYLHSWVSPCLSPLPLAFPPLISQHNPWHSAGWPYKLSRFLAYTILLKY